MGKKYMKREGEKHNKRDRREKEEGEKRKQMQGKRVRQAVWAQVGRISSRGSYRRMALGNGTTNTV